MRNDPDYRFEELVSEITNAICKAMKDNKVSRTQLADKLGISPPAVTRMLDGNPNFTLKRLLSVADALVILGTPYLIQSSFPNCLV